MPLYLKDKLVSGTGTPGKSAYEAAKAGGYTGTEASFNQALKDIPGHIADTENPHGVTAAQAGAIASIEKGATNGVATLGVDALLAAAQRPKAGGLYRDDGTTTVEASLAEISTTLQNNDPRNWGLDLSKSLADANDGTRNGFYAMTTGAANVPFDYGVLLVHNNGNPNYVHQELTRYYDGIKVCRSGSYDDSTSAVKWGPWEYVNPPMDVGYEYRTTERRNGLPVYTQFKNLGKIVNGAYGDISVTNLDSVVGYEAFWVNRPLPIIKNSSLTDAETQYLNVYVLNANTIRVYYYGGTSVSGNGDVYVLVKYTKST